MLEKAKKNDVVFRPHFKTHQSLEIGNWFKELGVKKIAVSSVTMAEYFALDFDDITIAFPTNINEIDKINEIASTAKLNLLVESKDTIALLSEKIKHPINVFIKVDVGYHRTGIDPEDTDSINRILNVIDNCTLIQFSGFLGHAGHTYKCRDKEEIRSIHYAALKIMNVLKESFKVKYPSLITSLGDTPSCSILDDFEGVDEIRPGNFVFYDLTQHQIGSNAIAEIAVAMACPIVAIHNNRSEIIIYGGGVHFSKEFLNDESQGTIYGVVVETLDDGWGKPIKGMYLKSLSQEHGIISVPASQIGNYKIGDILLILPVHSCMTANAMKSYLSNSSKISRL